MEFIIVKYSCKGCDLYRVDCQVSSRTTEDVVHWTKNILGHAVGLDHSIRSPFCSSKTMSEVMIPITGASKIGGVSEN